MTQYLLSVWITEGQAPPPEAEMQQNYQRVGVLNQKLQDEGVWVFAGGLHPPATATVVRAKGDEILTTDGPFAETKEQIGGFWVISVADLDAALDWAAKATVACGAPVEVRPFQDMPEAQ